jgi:hypothetical protein
MELRWINDAEGVSRRELAELPGEVTAADLAPLRDRGFRDANVLQDSRKRLE